MKTTKLPCQDCSQRKNSIFCELENQVLQNVTDAKIMNNYKKGQTLFHEGTPPFGLFCINSGKVKLSRSSSDGKEAIVRIVGPGDMLGQKCLVGDGAYEETATALEDAQVCFLDKKYIQSLVHDKPELALQVINKMNHEIEEAEEKVAHYFHKNVRERLAELFLQLNEKYGIQEEDGRIRLDIKLTREELAGMVGVATETLIRFVSEFKDEGLVDQQGKTIYITNKTKLNEFAGN